MADLVGTQWGYNSGWNSGTIGDYHSYTAAADSSKYRTELEISIPAPSVGYKISKIIINVGLVYNGGGTTTLTGYMSETSPNIVSGPPTSYVTSATSDSVTLSSGGAMVTLEFTIPDSYNWTTAKTLSIWLCTSKSAVIEVWTKQTGNVTKASYTMTETPYGTVSIYNGTSWEQAIPYIYDGTGWKQAIPYIYNGTAWRICGG